MVTFAKRKFVQGNRIKDCCLTEKTKMHRNYQKGLERNCLVEMGDKNTLIMVSKRSAYPAEVMCQVFIAL
jgi:hypothetical protein